MIIKNEEYNFIFPFDELSNQFVLISNGYKKEIIDCFSSYFVSKKKSKCIIEDEDGNKVNMSDINFIYLPNDLNYSQNVELKTKSIMNDEIAKFIKENPGDFQSIELIENGLKELLTDKGVIKLSKVINEGLNNSINFGYEHVDICALLQMLKFELKDSNYIKLAILNILLFENRDNLNIIYFDDELDETVLNWLNSLPNNVYVIVDSESYKNLSSKFDLLILSSYDHLIKENASPDVIKRLIYMNNPYIKSNLEFQNEKNIQLFNAFYDKTSTFMIKNNCLDSRIAL